MPTSQNEQEEIASGLSWEERAAALYVSGLSLVLIAKRLGTSPFLARAAIVSTGAKIRPHGTWSSTANMEVFLKRRDAIRQAHLAGATKAAIARQHGISAERVRQILERRYKETK